jgi:hypothetical protein
MAIGFDVGTYNLVCSKRDDKGNFVHKREVNAFIEIPLEHDFVFNMMKNAGVPLIQREKLAYALGESAVKMAYAINSMELKRPMSDGCVNPKEKEAYQILSIMVHSLIETVKEDKEVLYYCVPANAINVETDAGYHQKILEGIFKAFRNKDGLRVDPHPINEALALVYAELSKKAYTGIGISFGAGMVNLCMAMFGNPVFSFAIVNSGDWIDKQAARATAESPTFINKQKMKIDLSKPPTDLVERAIHTQYRLMIEHCVSEIRNGLSKNSKVVRTDEPFDIVVSGGTSTPNGFVEMFKGVLDEAKLPIQVGEIIRPPDTLYSVARGCLLAAEAAVRK